MRRAEATLPRDCRPWRGGTGVESEEGVEKGGQRHNTEIKGKIEIERKEERDRESGGKAGGGVEKETGGEVISREPRV